MIGSVQHKWTREDITTRLAEPFKNEPVLELRREAVRSSLLSALKDVDNKPPLKAPVWTGVHYRRDTRLKSIDPGNPEHVVTIAGRALGADVKEAVDALTVGQIKWGALRVEERASVLLRGADELRSHRERLAAIIVRECAKPWAEADADVCEAIDFLEYYARQAIKLQSNSRDNQLLQLPGEQNILRYFAKGIVGVIAPWNFPLAIPTGMTAAALVVGNAVILKPAEQSPGCAYLLADALYRAGLPMDVLAFLPGYGDMGEAIVQHPGVHTIAFTGSQAVGLKIIEKVAERYQGQKHIKHVVAELGGKNCIIVDSDADLDEAVPAIITSAFAYAGQKCSAAARILVHERSYELLLQRLAGAVETLNVGQAEDFSSDVPPLIDDEARSRVTHYIQLAKTEGRIVAMPITPLPKNGHFVTPLLIADLPLESPLLCQEIFGPILTIEPVLNIEEAITRVNELPVALTAGIFSRNPVMISYMITQLPAGNVYVNRAITGAMVGRQPFGGNRLSGTGSKAGGPDYLLNFVEPRVTCTNTTRHGLVIL